MIRHQEYEKKIKRERGRGIERGWANAFPFTGKTQSASLKPCLFLSSPGLSTTANHSKPLCFYVFSSFLVLRQTERYDFTLPITKRKDRVHVIRKPCLRMWEILFFSVNLKPGWFFSSCHIFYYIYFKSHMHRLYLFLPFRSSHVLPVFQMHDLFFFNRDCSTPR